MAYETIDVNRAFSAWELYRQLPIMVRCGLISQAESDQLKAVLAAIFRGVFGR